MLDDASRNIEMTHTGKALKPEVSLKHGDTELVKGKDYTLAYSNNTKVSTDVKPAVITVKGKGNYSGSFKVSFTIIPKEADTTVNPSTKNVKSGNVEDAELLEDAELVEDTEDESVEDEETKADDESAEDEESETGEESADDEESDKDDESTEDADSKADDEPVEGEEPNTDEDSEEGEGSNTDEESVAGEESDEEGPIADEESITDEELEILSEYTGITVEELGAMSCDELESVLLEALSDYTGINIEGLGELNREELKSMLKDMGNKKSVVEEVDEEPADGELGIE